MEAINETHISENSLQIEEREPNIGFSHKTFSMFKGKPPETAVLLACVPVRLEELPKEFLAWDTRFTGEDGLEENFELPATGLYLLYFFFDPKSENLFATLRKHNKMASGFGYYNRFHNWEMRYLKR